MHSSYCEGGNFAHALRLFKLMLSYIALLLQADIATAKAITDKTLIDLPLENITVGRRQSDVVKHVTLTHINHSETTWPLLHHHAKPYAIKNIFHIFQQGGKH